MANEFVQTRLTLLKRLAEARTGEDESSWARFFELYHPAMLAFVQGLGGRDAAEDVVQDVFVKLVDVIRQGKYDPTRGTSFRAYVKTLLRNQMVDLYRRECARGEGRTVALTPEIAEETPDARDEPGVVVDRKWALACHAAALRHVLTRMAHSEQTKAVYRALTLEGRSLEEVARAFGLQKNTVSQIRSRLDRVVELILAEYGS